MSAMERTDLAVEVSGLAFGYGRRRVLEGIDLAVPAGSVTGVVGVNGVGKSTLLRVLAEGLAAGLLLGPLLVAVALDRHGETPAELTALPEVAGVAELHDRPQFGEPVLHRRARQGDPSGGVERPDRRRLLGGRVLDVLRFVEHDQVDSARSDTDLTTGAVTTLDGAFAPAARYVRSGIFVQDEIPGELFDTTAGVRYSYYDFSFDGFGGGGREEGDFDSLTASVQLGRNVAENVRLTGTLAQGFRAPNLSDLTRFDAARSNEFETPAPGENSARSMPAKSNLSRSSTVTSSPAKGTAVPAERLEATAWISLIGNSRCSSTSRISLPTAPVAPTTAMVWLMFLILIRGAPRAGSAAGVASLY